MEVCWSHQKNLTGRCRVWPWLGQFRQTGMLNTVGKRWAELLQRSAERCLKERGCNIWPKDVKLAWQIPCCEVSCGDYSSVLSAIMSRRWENVVCVSVAFYREKAAVWAGWIQGSHAWEAALRQPRLLALVEGRNWTLEQAFMAMRSPSCAADKAVWDCLAVATKKPCLAPQQSCTAPELSLCTVTR